MLSKIEQDPDVLLSKAVYKASLLNICSALPSSVLFKCITVFEFLCISSTVSFFMCIWKLREARSLLRDPEEACNLNTRGGPTVCHPLFGFQFSLHKCFLPTSKFPPLSGLTPVFLSLQSSSCHC